MHRSRASRQLSFFASPSPSTSSGTPSLPRAIPVPVPLARSSCETSGYGFASPAAAAPTRVVSAAGVALSTHDNNNNYYNDDGAFPSSLLAPAYSTHHAFPHTKVAENEKEPCDTKDSELASRSASERKETEGGASLLDEKKRGSDESKERHERGEKSRAEGSSTSDSEESRRAQQYRDMKLRYMRSLAPGAGAGAGAGVRGGFTGAGTSSVSSLSRSVARQQIEQEEQKRKRGADVSEPSPSQQYSLESQEKKRSDDVLPVSSSSAAKPSLLSRLLSGRPPLSRPTSLSPPSPPTDIETITVGPPSSYTGYVLPSPSSSSSSSSSSSGMRGGVPTFERRTSPIMIPSRLPVAGAAAVHDGGVRYRKARPVTRAELEDDRRARDAAARVLPGPGVGAAPVAVPVPVAVAVGDFTFADVFAVPPGAVTRVAARPPTGLIDGFLAC